MKAVHVLRDTKQKLMLHRKDCWHPPHGARFRLATKTELASLPTCFHCAQADARDAVDCGRWEQAALEALQNKIAEPGRTPDDVREIEQIASEVQFARGFDLGNQEFDTTTFPRALAINGPLPSQLNAQAEATIASLPELVRRGPSAADQQAERDAERAERRKRRAERAARIRTTRRVA